MSESPRRPGPLDGILVLDLSRVLAGPLATMLLADLGARVIKIEEPQGGDPTRGWGPPFRDGESAYYLAFNRNKESVAVDLKSEEGIRLVRAIAKRADVVVENFPVGTVERLGLGWEELSALNPRLVWLSVTSFGRSGPEAGVPGFDFLVQAMSGWMSLTGPVDGDPTKAGLPLVDIVTGLHAFGAVTSALYARERSGRGERVEVSLFGSAISALGHVGQGYLVSGKPPARLGNGHPTIVPYEPFEASDGAFALAVGTESQWRQLCREVLADPLLAERQEFATNASRVANRAALRARLAAGFRDRTAGEWIERCRRAGVPAGPVRSVPEALSSDQARALGLIRRLDAPGRGAIDLLDSAIGFRGRETGPRSLPPLLDQDGEKVRREFLDPPAGSG